MTRFLPRCAAVLALAGLLLGAAARADEPGADFFERKVRPVLAEHCWKCHGPKKESGGVRLDGPQFIKRNVDGSGPVVVPGKPAESRLIRAVRHEGDVAMPPKGKLPAAAIDALAAWVEMGAPWPEAKAKAAADGTAHWAFRPVKAHPLPAVQDRAWPASPVDHFILGGLEARGLRPSPPADRRTLIRRVTFDLIGLPPTPAEVDAFLKDRSPDAFAKVVDRLLASPRYGERWGRHWLDVARYADTRGYPFDADARLPFAYSYRDWVIAAFNADMPFDRFVVQQLAADQLALDANDPELAALGFLTLGRSFLGNEPDIIDDRLDVLGRGLMGLSLGCARCHDHKYDPIPQQDYYSLYGVFAGTTDKEVPIFADAEGRAAYERYAKELRARRRALDGLVRQERQRVLGDYPVQGVERYLLATREAQPDLDDEGKRKDGLNENLVQRWRNQLAETAKDFNPVFAPWHAFAALEPDRFAAEAPGLAGKFAANADEEKKLNARVAGLFAGKPPASLAEVAGRYAALFGRVAQAWQKVRARADAVDADPPQRLKSAIDDEIRALVQGKDAPLAVPDDELRDMLGEEKQKQFDDLRDRIDEWRTGPDARPHALVLRDPDEPVTPHVFIRGKADQPAEEELPRQFLSVLAGPGRKPFAEGTGRLELARAVASPDNPLTARVWVNRVWRHHFGRGLVATPSDFGTRSEPPSHPELLDELARRFIASGWSTKALHRMILLSRAYQQASADRPEARAVDPDNRLLWRMNRRRLEVEALRDALLAVAGHLDLTAGGRPVDLAAEPLSGRRTVYGLVARQQLPGLLRAFDFANPDLHSPQRHETIAPQQALFWLNSPFAAEQARGVAARADATAPAGSPAWVRQVYRLVFGRAPTAAELASADRFFQAAARLGPPGPRAVPPVWRYGHGRWDEKAGCLRDFRDLPHFQDDSWRGGPEMPDPALGWVMLNAEGGHPGAGLAKVAVRRWVAPCAGVVSVEGALGHKLEEDDPDCDGVRGQIASGRKGVLKVVTAFKAEAKTDVTGVAVEAGDVIDFVVDCRANESNDSFTWPVTVVLEPTGRPGEEWTYSSVEDFRGPLPDAGPPLSAREKYTQVLLMTNEFLFVD
jgi:hypothetical protein